MIDLNNSVLILDGPSDISALRALLQKNFGSNPEFRRAPSNGHTVSPEGYASAILGIVDYALSDSFKHIICVLDREKRPISAEALAESIHSELVNKLTTKAISKEQLDSRIFVIAADRMLENWIIADVEGIKVRDIVKQSATQDYYDGVNGTNKLTSFLDVRYKKTQHAPLLLKAINIERAKSNSPSFEKFSLALGC